MRSALCFALALVACSASADRLFSVPTARKLPYRTVRVEFAAELGQDSTQLGYVGMGVGTSFEAAFRTERLPDSPTVGAFDFDYNYIAAIPGLTPGIAFGVQDVLNKTVDGRAGYACVTWREPLQTLDGDVPADVTLGTFFRSHNPAFLGLSLPFSHNFRIIVEHNGFRLTSGFELRPAPEVAVRLLVRDTHVLADLSLLRKF